MSTPHPKVAVVIPAFHAEKWLHSCLDSVAAQSFDSWQVFVVEDGSKDATQQIVAEFAAAFPGQFTYIQSPQNIGPAAARNLGIRQSASEFVAFIDADDVWTRDHLSTLVEGAVMSGCALAYARFTEFSSEAEAMLDQTKPCRATREVTPLNLFENSPLLPSCVLVTRKTLLEMGLFDESLRWAEDLDLWIRLMRNGAQFHDSRRPTCWRRVSEMNLTSNSAKVAEYTGKLYLRHLAWEALDPRAVRQRAAHHLSSAARMYFWSDPKLSANLYYQSWSVRRHLVANLGCFILARLAMLVPRQMRIRLRRKPQLPPTNGAISHVGAWIV